MLKLTVLKFSLLVTLILSLTAIQIACNGLDGDDSNDCGDGDDDNDAANNATYDDDPATPIPGGHDLSANCYSCHTNAHNGEPSAPEDCTSCHPHS